MIQFKCGSCGREIKVKDEYAGRQGKCPGCGTIVTVPAAQVAAPAGATGATAPPLSPAPQPGAPQPGGAQPGAPFPGMSPAPYQYAPPQAAPSKGQATAALVLGLCSIFIPGAGAICAILALVFGIMALSRKMPGKGMAIGGVITAGVGVVAQVGVFALMIYGLNMSRDLARMTVCQANLSATIKGCALYSAMTNDVYPFPMLVQYGDPEAPVSSSTQIPDFNSKYWDGKVNALGTNAMQNIWLLVYQNMIGWGSFRCPGDSGWQRVSFSGSDKYGWSSPAQFSYGYTWPYDGPRGAAAPTNPAKLSDPNGLSGQVVFADRNSGGSVSRSRPPSNHPYFGTAYARRDCSVSMYRSTKDSKAGYAGDDIYINTAGEVGGIPKDSPALSGNSDTSITPGNPRP